jgi:lysophospholipase L1-like esterase
MTKTMILLSILFLSVLLLSCQKDLSYEYGSEEKLVKIWSDEIIYNETVVLVNDGQTISGNLLFEPTQIISVRDYTLEKEYDPSEYEIVGNQLIRTETSSMPYLDEENLYGINMPDAYAFSTYQAKENGQFILFTEGIGIVMHQVAVTYKHEGSMAGIKPAYQPDALSNALQKLKNKEDINIVINGDSISTGANSSGVLGIMPYLDDFGTLFSNHLAESYDVNVNLYNTSVGGTVSSFGKENVDANINQYNPDLVIIGYGMNDGSLGVTPLEYRENIEFMIRSIRARKSDTDIILISTILANPLSIQNQGQEDYLAELEELKSLYSVALLDMTTISKELFKVKRSVDILANNINHPSDFLVRIYAAALIATIEE